ncbi:MAG: biotin-dependent carboxyltransferase family protein [Bacteroidota bacterium]
MGKLRILKCGPITTIQDEGRFGYRKYGIPQSGAMDQEMMHAVIELLGNSSASPVIEFALAGLELEAIEDSTVAVLGADFAKNGVKQKSSFSALQAGDRLSVDPPRYVYAYLGIAGKLLCQMTMNSYSTLLSAKLGGLDGRSLRKGDFLQTESTSEVTALITEPSRNYGELLKLQMKAGPEWSVLRSEIETISFAIGRASNRTGISLEGPILKQIDFEMSSSSVIPGTIQLLPSGKLIVLMKDCQTTGGYPRIGQLMREDLSKLAQAKVGQKVRFTHLNA